MSGFIDLHCHWLPGVDDGARSLADGREMLHALFALGFTRVFATPHIRAALFDNTPEELKTRYAEVCGALGPDRECPEHALAAEHFYDDVNHRRLLDGHGLPYPGGKAALIEFQSAEFPYRIQQRLAELGRVGLRPVLAHPERYRPLWDSPEPLEELLDVGVATLLDVCALAGKYGAKAARAAEGLLDLGLYHAACTDAHSVEDVHQVERGLSFIVKHYGDEELQRLFVDGPSCLLAGALPD
jgi:protein-tyrosine phosphatase